jgi:hypothetical protein
MKLLDVITAAGARVSGGDPHLWKCFGPNANFMEFRDADGNGCSHCIFDTFTQEVYLIHADVPGTDQAFDWIDPQHLQAYLDECKEHEIDPNIAWDDVRYTHVDAPTMLQYLKDIGDTYYDNLPVLETSMVMDMPGTMGGAKVVWNTDEETNT